MKTPFQLTNILNAIAEWKTYVKPETVIRELAWYREGPTEDFDFDPFTPPTCNTPACFAGWLPHLPSFRALGVTPTPEGVPEFGGMNFGSLGVHLFGSYNLFDRRGGPLDKGFTGTDYELVLHRLEKALES